MDTQLPRARFVVIWLLPLACLVASLVHPEARALQTALIRLLLPLPSTVTEVHGQPAGCVVSIVPEVEFTRTMSEEHIRRRTASPDDYIVGDGGLRQPGPFPRSELWKGHPLLLRGALRVANSIPIPHSDVPASRPISAEGLKDALRLVQLAQTTYPQNAPLCLAEAHLRFLMEDRAGAINALATALNKVDWRYETDDTRQYHQELLESRGLPRFEAAILSGSFRGACAFALSYRVLDHLEARITDAIRAGDDRQVADVLSLWARLRTIRRGDWQGPVFYPLHHFLDGSPSAAARQLNRTLPPILEANSTQVRHQTVKDYLEAHAPADLVNAVWRDDPAFTPEQQQKLDATREKFDLLKPALMSSMRATQTFVALAFTLSVLFAQLPYVLARRNGYALPWRWVPFWIAQGIVVIAAFALVYHATHSVFQPVGLRSSDGPRPGVLESNAVLSVLLVCMVGLLRGLLVHHLTPARMLHVACWCGYFALVAITTSWRLATIATVEAMPNL